MKYFFDPGPDYKGRMFTDFYPSKDCTGPGWFLLGKNPEYDGRLRKVCAWLDVKPRHYKLWNGLVRRGFHSKKEAQAVADQLNKERAA